MKRWLAGVLTVLALVAALVTPAGPTGREEVKPAAPCTYCEWKLATFHWEA